MADEDVMDPAGPDITAGEYALGVLEGDELVSAHRRVLADRDFAERVEWWHLRLSCMAEAAGEYEPSSSVWPAIQRRLQALVEHESPTPDTITASQPKGFSGRQIGIAMGGAAVAAVALTLLFVQPAATPPVAPVETAAPATGERLVAQLQNEDGTLSLAGLVDPQAGQIAVSLTGFEPGEGQATELWVVPAGGAPQSLGLVPASGALDREMTAAERAALVEGAALAVTYEDAASAPHDAPGGEILVAGGLTSI